MSKEILVNGVGKQNTVFYYNFQQAAYQSRAFGNTTVFSKISKMHKQNNTQFNSVCIKQAAMGSPLVDKHRPAPHVIF